MSGDSGWPDCVGNGNKRQQVYVPKVVDSDPSSTNDGPPEGGDSRAEGRRKK